MIDRRDALAAVAVLLLLPTAADALDSVWVADARGCKVLLDVEKAGDVGVQWVGPCRGYANGNGTVQISYKGRPAGWYAGPVVGGKYEGKGIRSYPNGARYEGEWRDSKRNGHGVQKYASGAVYEGGWRAGPAP